MLTPNEYDRLCDQLMHLYWELDETIVADMTRRLMKTGGDYLPDTAAWQAERMQESGLLYEDIIAEISRRSGMTQRQVAKTFERAGVQCIRNDNRCITYKLIVIGVILLVLHSRRDQIQIRLNLRIYNILRIIRLIFRLIAWHQININNINSGTQIHSSRGY